jgi:hypothetical protein
MTREVSELVIPKEDRTHASKQRSGIGEACVLLRSEARRVTLPICTLLTCDLTDDCSHVALPPLVVLNVPERRKAAWLESNSAVALVKLMSLGRADGVAEDDGDMYAEGDGESDVDGEVDGVEVCEGEEDGVDVGVGEEDGVSQGVGVVEGVADLVGEAVGEGDVAPQP